MPRRLDVKRNFFSEGELARFLDSARDDREKLYWLLMADSGVRLGELLKITWGELKENALKVFGKGSRYRLVPITARVRELAKAVQEEAQETDHARVVNSGARAVQARFERAYRRSGIGKPRMCCHSLRHTFATRALQAGVDIHRVGVLLGHRSTFTTMGYLHASSRVAEEVAAQMDRFNTGSDGQGRMDCQSP